MTSVDKHIDWIDGAKGVAILSVILLHSLPCLREIGWIWHIGQAVPVFLFITAYLISIRFILLWIKFLIAVIVSLALNKAAKRTLKGSIVINILIFSEYIFCARCSIRKDK